MEILQTIIEFIKWIFEFIKDTSSLEAPFGYGVLFIIILVFSGLMIYYLLNFVYKILNSLFNSISSAVINFFELFKRKETKEKIDLNPILLKLDDNMSEKIRLLSEDIRSEIRKEINKAKSKKPDII